MQSSLELVTPSAFRRRFHFQSLICLLAVVACFLFGSNFAFAEQFIDVGAPAQPAGALACNVVAGEKVRIELAHLKLDGATAEVKSALEAFLPFQDDPAILKLAAAEDVVATLLDDDLDLYGTRLAAILNEYFQRRGEATQEQRENILRELFIKQLQDQVPYSSIPSRVGSLISGDRQSLRRALGDMELIEVQDWMFGLGGPEKSLLKQYLQETGAATRLMSFSKGPGYEGVGEQRLLVAVSASSVSAFLKYFSRRHWLSPQGHANMIFGGRFYSFNGTVSDFRLPSVNTPLPAAVVKTSESIRLHRFIDAAMGKGSWSHEIKQPWRLAGYCAASRWTCCTQWWGTMPIGDKIVDEYSFPSANDGHGNAVPNTQKLQDYAACAYPVTRRIWRVPGHQMFSGVLGLEENNNRSEFANPGWVITTLLGHAPLMRVPVVFYVVDDHKAPLPENPTFTFEAPR